jgi:lipoprotein-releasing system permease protein
MNQTAFHIARTHLLSRKKQSFIAILGVTFGIAMFILMISFMTGINDFLSDNMLAATPHLRIYNDVEMDRHALLEEYYQQTQQARMVVVRNQRPGNQQAGIRNGMTLVQLIQADERVLGVSPQLTSQVFYNFGPLQLNGIIAGVDIMEENKLFDLKSKMRSGNIESLLTVNDGIIVGVGLARKFNLQTGDKVTVTTPAGTTLPLKVVGIFAFGLGAIDNVRSYANISTVQKILQRESGYISEIHLKLHNLNQARSMATTYQQQYGYTSEDWETANSSIMVSFSIRNAMTFVVVITLLVVAGFGIYNIMSMSINEKMKDIAILKATGFSGHDVMAIFMIQAIAIGSIGALLGEVLGFLLSWFISTIPFDSGEFIDLDHFPVTYHARHYIFGLVFGIVTTCLAGFMPARKASKIDPVAILRG